MKKQPSITEKSYSSHSVLTILISSNEQLITGIEQTLQDHEQFVPVLANEGILPLRRNFRMGMNAPIILLDFEGRESETSGLMADIRKYMPSASVIALSKKASQDHIQKSFLFGASGYITGKDRTQKLVPMLLSYVKSGYPPVSKDVVPLLINIARGSTASAIDLTSLSELQKNVARALASGMSYQEIADSMQMNLDNLRYHIKQVYKKLNITKRMHLVSMV
ncbi:MAG: LuxR C-terminal-related transcriptional regulator [Saprospiraceae bacterium]|jgi:DNA-binding NarL/FixJ family response regulator|nr:LuxR C-terminal-related transcriptional regulator [Saprospiraceae bacterium]